MPSLKLAPRIAQRNWLTRLKEWFKGSLPPIKLAPRIADLVGTRVPFDITDNVDWRVGHHVLCESIVPLVNAPGYLVNGNQLLPAAIADACLAAIASGAKAAADSTRPQSTTWTPDKPQRNRLTRLKEFFRWN